MYNITPWTCWQIPQSPTRHIHTHGGVNVTVVTSLLSSGTNLFPLQSDCRTLTQSQTAMNTRLRLFNSLMSPVSPLNIMSPLPRLLHTCSSLRHQIRKNKIIIIEKKHPVSLFFLNLTKMYSTLNTVFVAFDWKYGVFHILFEWWIDDSLSSHCVLLIHTYNVTCLGFAC